MSSITPSQPASIAPTGCCPPFDAWSWNEREVIWKDHPFVRQHITSLFHIPLNMGRKITSAKARIDAAGAAVAQGLMLCDETSPWGSELYIDVAGPVPGVTMATLSGHFLTKVYDGPFRDAPRWIADMKRYVASRGQAEDKIYLAYTTCPRCAKAYGHNYVVVFARVGDAVN